MSDPLLVRLFIWWRSSLCHRAVSLVDGLGDRRRGSASGADRRSRASSRGRRPTTRCQARSGGALRCRELRGVRPSSRQFRVAVHLVGFTRRPSRRGRRVGSGGWGAEVQQRVVLCMGVRTGGEPVVDERAGRRTSVIWTGLGVDRLTHQIADQGDRGAAVRIHTSARGTSPAPDINPLDAVGARGRCHRRTGQIAARSSRSRSRSGAESFSPRGFPRISAARIVVYSTTSPCFEGCYADLEDMRTCCRRPVGVSHDPSGRRAGRISLSTAKRPAAPWSAKFQSAGSRRSSSAASRSCARQRAHFPASVSGAVLIGKTCNGSGAIGTHVPQQIESIGRDSPKCTAHRWRTSSLSGNKLSIQRPAMFPPWADRLGIDTDRPGSVPPDRTGHS